MMKNLAALALMAGTGAVIAFGAAATATAQTIKRGGTLTFVTPSNIPSMDGHKESTFGVIHPLAPFYSLLIRVDPMNPQSTEFVCDLCEGDISKPTNDGKRYTFQIRKGVKFHDGTPLTAHDIVATHNKIIFPAPGVASSRQAFYSMVEKVSAPDDYTVVIDLKYAAAGFLPALATPFNWTYAKADLDKHGMNWHQNHANGSGPFQFVQHQPGAFVEGKRYDNYHHMGPDGKPQPYLDGFRAVIAPKMAVRVQAIRGDRAAIEFRGFPPKTRDDLVEALGDKITVQESDWNCNMGGVPNQNTNTKGDKFTDPRVRKALSLALDRWNGSKYLSKIAIVKSPSTAVIPTHPFAWEEDELKKIEIYDPDNDKRRATAKKLLADAGKSNLSLELWNRAVDQPYKLVGTWMIDEFKKIGVESTQAVVPSGPWYDGLRKKKDFDVAIDFNCQSVVNPLVDAAKWISADKTGNNYGSYIDRKVDEMYNEMNREPDAAKQEQMIHEFWEYVVNEQAHWIPAFWWYKINPHRSYVKGWKIAPSHYLNQQLDTVWLDK